MSVHMFKHIHVYTHVLTSKAHADVGPWRPWPMHMSMHTPVHMRITQCTYTVSTSNGRLTPRSDIAAATCNGGSTQKWRITPIDQKRRTRIRGPAVKPSPKAPKTNSPNKPPRVKPRKAKRAPRKRKARGFALKPSGLFLMVGTSKHMCTHACTHVCTQARASASVSYVGTHMSEHMSKYMSMHMS